MSDLYRDFIDQKADQIINSLGGTITPAVPNELYRDFLDRKFNDVINAIVGNNPVKSFKYTGVGYTGTNKIYYPSDCHMILFIEGNIVSSGTPAYNYAASIAPIPIRTSGTMEGTVVLNIKNATNRSEVPWHITFYNNYIDTSSSSNAIYNMNQSNTEYTVYYI